jgi:hypothetical protein
VRTDGPHLVWVGLAEHERVVDRVEALAERAARGLADHLRGEPELVVLDPTPRSRLRAGAGRGEHGRPAAGGSTADRGATRAV